MCGGIIHLAPHCNISVAQLGAAAQGLRAADRYTQHCGKGFAICVQQVVLWHTPAAGRWRCQ